MLFSEYCMPILIAPRGIGASSTYQKTGANAQSPTDATVSADGSTTNAVIAISIGDLRMIVFQRGSRYRVHRNGCRPLGIC